MCREDCSSLSTVLDGIPMIPRPPSLAGRAKRKHSRSLGGGLPVSVGRSWERSRSRDFIFWEMLGVVRLRYVHLLISPCVRAAKAACGWVLAISVNSIAREYARSWRHHSTRALSPLHACVETSDNQRDYDGLK